MVGGSLTNLLFGAMCTCGSKTGKIPEPRRWLLPGRWLTSGRHPGYVSLSGDVHVVFLGLEFSVHPSFHGLFPTYFRDITCKMNPGCCSADRGFTVLPSTDTKGCHHSPQLPANRSEIVWKGSLDVGPRGSSVETSVTG